MSRYPPPCRWIAAFPVRFILPKPMTQKWGWLPSIFVCLAGSAVDV
jgi:hypothetical protein